MSGLRRAWIDVSPGETRGVVELDGKPEHLLIDRDGEGGFARLGERYVARVASAGPEGAFVDLGRDPQGWLDGHDGACATGARILVEVAAEARADKGPRLRFVEPADGPPRLVTALPPLERRLCALAGVEPGAVGRGADARAAADRAQEAALATIHGFKGGLRLTIEPTRALISVDVDVASPRPALVREANLRAIRETGRLLRLKALGGLVAIDLAGLRPPPGLARAEAAAVFAADGPDVRVWPLAAAGLLLVSKPHGRRPLAERLLGAGGEPRLSTRACEVLRELERRGRDTPGARFQIEASASMAAVLEPLVAPLGARFSVRRRLGDDALCADILEL